MTKADIVENIAEKMSRTKDEAYDLLELTLEILKQAIISEENVKISGFGNFSVQQKRARKGRNPQTGDEITITPRKILTFKASPVLKQKVNQG